MLNNAAKQDCYHSVSAPKALLLHWPMFKKRCSSVSSVPIEQCTWRHLWASRRTRKADMAPENTKQHIGNNQRPLYLLRHGPHSKLNKLSSYRGAGIYSLVI